jgi:hypothetical protein
MLERRYRKTPSGFSDFTKRFGWSLRDAVAFVGRIPEKKEMEKRRYARRKILVDDAEVLDVMNERDLRTTLRNLAKEYMWWFNAKPKSVHVFPLKGAYFQYEFARGVRDALFLAGIITKKPVLRTIATIREVDGGTGEGEIVNYRSVMRQAEKIGLNKGKFVVHDFFSRKTTLNAIEGVAGKRHSGLHALEEGQVYAGGNVPIKGVMKKIGVGGITGKKIRRNEDEINLEPDALYKKEERERYGKGYAFESEYDLTAYQIAFVKRTVYAAGVASAREVLKSQYHKK